MQTYELLQHGGPHDRLQVLDMFFERKLDAVAIGEAEAAPVVAEHRAAPHQQRAPGPPDRTVPIELEVTNPMSGPQQGRTFAARGVGKAVPSRLVQKRICC